MKMFISNDTIILIKLNLAEGFYSPSPLRHQSHLLKITINLIDTIMHRTTKYSTHAKPLETLVLH